MHCMQRVAARWRGSMQRVEVHIGYRLVNYLFNFLNDEKLLSMMISSRQTTYDLVYRHWRWKFWSHFPFSLQTANINMSKVMHAKTNYSSVYTGPSSLPAFPPENDIANPPFRLQFNTEPFVGNTIRATRVISAMLRLKKKATVVG